MKTLQHQIVIMLLFASMAMPFFFVSCTKEEQTPPATDTVNWGYVKEYYTEKPIPNAMLILYGKNPLWAVQDTLYTDANGRYEFPIVKYLPELQASAPNYIGDRMYTQDELVGRFNRTIHLYQPAEMILHVKNVNPVDASDRVDLTDFFDQRGEWTGSNIDTLVCCLTTRRYTEVLIGVWVTKNQINYSDHVKYTPLKAIGNIVSIFY